MRVLNAVTSALHIPFSLTGSSAQIPFLSDGAPPFFLTYGLTVKRSEYEGMAVWTLTPPDPSGQYVVAIHGGSFIGQVSVFHWWNYTDMARQTGATIVVPLYELAPKGNAAKDIPIMANFIGSQVSTYGTNNVSVIGDSAGGTIALASLQELVRRNAPVPGRLVLLSPALDQSDTFKDPVNDPLLSDPKSVEANHALWAGGLSLTDPIVSPLYGSLDGLPPTTVYSGSDDLLGKETLELRDRVIASESTNFTFELRNGQFHDWTLFAFLPDATAERPGVYRALGL